MTGKGLPFINFLRGNNRHAFRWEGVLALLLSGLFSASAASSGYLIQNWLAKEGIPENSALAVAQTPDGYLWVGSGGGLLRFNGLEFVKAEEFSDLTRLKAVVFSLRTVRSGRLWASTDAGLALYDKGNWQRINGSNSVMRTVAEDAAGRAFLGGFEGQVWTVTDNTILPFSPPENIQRSGVFCMSDTLDGSVWLANRGFIGRLTKEGWKRDGPTNGTVSNALVATVARNGGIWVYYRDELWRYRADGTATLFKAPVVDQPRELLEDSSGSIWIASTSRGLTRFKPGGRALSITSTNGLSHNSIWCIIEDKERNIWAGGSIAGLHRLKAQQFVTISMANGMPNNVVRSVTEDGPGQIIVGTHGGGTARIRNGHVVSSKALVDEPRFRYSWSVLRDKSGQLWTGTFNGGLLVESNGVASPFSLPDPLGNIVNSMMQDSQGRIWVGTFSGMAAIQSNSVIACSTNSALAGLSIVAIAEDPKTGAIYAGTYNNGVFRLDKGDFARAAKVIEIPSTRISSLTVDSSDYLWVGMFDRGLACYHDGMMTAIGRPQGLPADTIGSILEDGLGWYWMGSTRGVLRVSRDELFQVVKGALPRAAFNLFNDSDGLDSEYCTEGYQPAAIRDSFGHLWFGTAKGVVTVDPTKLRVNTNSPPVRMVRVGYTDNAGSNHVIFPAPDASVEIPPGSVELEFDFDVLSYTAPEKVRLAYRMEGADDNWVDLGKRHELHFRALPPGKYHLQVKAANNDGLWNETGATLAFNVNAFLSETTWFRLLSIVAVALAAGFLAWRLTSERVKHRTAHITDLQRREEQFRSLIENASDLITVMDRKMIISFQSPSSERLLGFKPEQMVGRDVMEFIHPEDQLKANESLRNLLANPGGSVAVTARFKHANGNWRLLEAAGRYLPGNGGGGELILNTRDITDSKKLEEQFRQAQKMEAVGMLAGGVAHDFNNILAASLMQLSLLQQEPDLNPDFRAALKDLEEGSNRAAALTRQLLLFSRRQVMEKKTLDLGQLLNGLVRMLRRLLGEHVQLLLHGQDEPIWADADAGMIEQVVTNLCINARDAMPEGGGLTIDTGYIELNAITCQAHEEGRPGKFICLTVADTGCGMSETTMRQVFEPFFTTKGIGKGSGLGLATVFGIVKQHQGWIEVQSEVGVGSVFRVFLPAAEPPVLKHGPDAEKTFIFGKEVILLVEDNKSLRNLTSQWLQRLGYRVLEAVDGREGMEHWSNQNGKIDLLLTDMVMPGGISGLELAEKLRAINPNLKVIIASGYSLEIARRSQLQDRGIMYLAKPYEGPTLAAVIRQCLDGE